MANSNGSGHDRIFCNATNLSALLFGMLSFSKYSWELVDLNNQKKGVGLSVSLLCFVGVTRTTIVSVVDFLRPSVPTFTMNRDG